MNFWNILIISQLVLKMTTILKMLLKMDLLWKKEDLRKKDGKVLFK